VERVEVDRPLIAAQQPLLADVFALNQARLLQPVCLAGERGVADAEFARKLGQCSALFWAEIELREQTRLCVGPEQRQQQRGKRSHVRIAHQIVCITHDSRTVG